jgi:hypothetical protein
MDVALLLVLLMLLSGPFTYLAIQRPGQGIGCLMLPAILFGAAAVEVRPVRGGCYLFAGAGFVIPISLALLARWKESHRETTQPGTGLIPQDPGHPT